MINSYGSVSVTELTADPLVYLNINDVASRQYGL